jgi:hypothetical protein
MTNNENTDFERNVRSSLKDYEVAFQPSDWEEMESKLNTLPKNTAMFRFQWKFSMNVFVMLLAGAGLSFLIIKAGFSSSKSNNKAETHTTPNTPATPALNAKNTEPRTIPSSDETAEEKASENIVTTVPDAQHPVLISVPQAPVQTNPSSSLPKNGDAIVSSGTHSDSPSNSQASVDLNKNSSPGPLNPELLTPPMRIYGDQIDPGQGYIYSTKEKPGDVPVMNQSSVNVGWNTYVIYDPKTKEADTVKAQAIVPAGESVSSENHVVKKEKSEKKGKSSKTSRDAEKEVVKAEKEGSVKDTTSDQKKAEPKTASIQNQKKDDAPADSVKKNRKMGKKPKFQGDKSIIDP